MGGWIYVTTLYGDPYPKLSPNRGRGNVRSQKAQQAAKREWQAYANRNWIAFGARTFPGPIEVKFEVFRCRVTDPDNYVAAMKPVIDGIKLTPDDTDPWRKGYQVNFTTGKDRGPDRIVVWARPAVKDRLIMETVLVNQEPKDASVL